MMLAILVPSRGRPNNLRRLVDAVRSTVSGDVWILTRLDSDDRTRDEYQGIADFTVTGPRVFYAASVNELARIAAAHPKVTHLAMFGDDVVPETPGWDQMLVDSLGGWLGIAYGSDGLEHLHGPDLPTHFITQAETYRRLGWLALPTIRHLFLDDVARELGKGLGNFQYVPQAKLTHLHRWNKTAPDDDTYREANDKHKRETDRRAYLEWRNGPGYADAIARLTA